MKELSRWNSFILQKSSAQRIFCSSLSMCRLTAFVPAIWWNMDEFIWRRWCWMVGLVGGELFVVFNIRKVRALTKGPWSRWRVRDEHGEVDEGPPHPRICLRSTAVFTQPLRSTALLLLSAKCIHVCLKHSERSFPFSLCVCVFIFCPYFLIMRYFVIITALDLENDEGFLWRHNIYFIIMTGPQKSVLALSLFFFVFSWRLSFLVCHVFFHTFRLCSFHTRFVCTALISLYLKILRCTLHISKFDGHGNNSGSNTLLQSSRLCSEEPCEELRANMDFFSWPSRPLIGC